MRKTKILLSAAVATTGIGLALAIQPASAQAQAKKPAPRVQPERKLVGVTLGRPYSEVIRRFGSPQEIQTVALAVGGSQLPGVGGGGPAAGGSPFGGGSPYPGSGGGYPGSGGGYPGSGGGYPGSGGGYPGSGGGYPGSGGGSSPFGGGSSPFGGGSSGMSGGAASGVPTLPPPGAGGSSPFGGGGSSPFGGGSPFGAPAAGLGGGGAASGPEYSNAILWIYKRPGNVRLEFLINEDGRVAQISAVAPVNRLFKPATTSKGVTLGSDFTSVMSRYGNPERHRMLPGGRFYEAYYLKNYHTAFAFDTSKGQMKVVRITIALAD